MMVGNSLMQFVRLLWQLYAINWLKAKVRKQHIEFDCISEYVLLILVVFFHTHTHIYTVLMLMLC